MIDVARLRLNKKGAEALLSPLESRVLGILWSQPDGEIRVRDIHRQLRGKRVALTSVAVILDRLHSKGFVARRAETGRGGDFYLYRPRTSREEFERSVVGRTVDKLIESFGASAVNYFHERFSAQK